MTIRELLRDYLEASEALNRTDPDERLDGEEVIAKAQAAKVALYEEVDRLTAAADRAALLNAPSVDRLLAEMVDFRERADALTTANRALAEEVERSRRPRRRLQEALGITVGEGGPAPLASVRSLVKVYEMERSKVALPAISRPIPEVANGPSAFYQIAAYVRAMPGAKTIHGDRPIPATETTHDGRPLADVLPMLDDPDLNPGDRAAVTLAVCRWNEGRKWLAVEALRGLVGGA